MKVRNLPCRGRITLLIVGVLLAGVITHDLALVAHGRQRVVVMQQGRVVEHGRTAEVLGAPKHPYTAALVAAARCLGGQQ